MGARENIERLLEIAVLVSAFDVSDPVISDLVWQPPSPAAKIAVTAADARSRARLDC